MSIRGIGIADMLRMVANDFDKLEALRAEIGQLRDIRSAAQTALTSWLTAQDQPERIRADMQHLYRMTRDDLWRESQAEDAE